MRDARKLLTAIALVAALHRERAAGSGPDGPRRRHRQGRTGPANQGRHGRRRKPARRPLVVHRDHRRQGPLFDHRPPVGHLEDHGVGAWLHARRRQRAASAPSARRIRRSISCSRPALQPGRPGRWPASTPRNCRASWPKAEDLMNEQQYDAAIAAYQAILTKTPALTMINLQIGRALSHEEGLRLGARRLQEDARSRAHQRARQDRDRHDQPREGRLRGSGSRA